jgi:hypothetical protein
MSVTGTSKVLANLMAVAREAPIELGRAMFEVSEEKIMARAKDLSPVDEGIMRASGFVELPKVEGNTVSVRMGFGGASSDYVVVQHEDLSLHHDVGQAKFLEQPVNEARPTLARDIVARVSLNRMVR